MAIKPRSDERLRLVEAACAAFAEKGYASTRVAEIAERAGCGKGTVYEYFSSKEELLFAVFESINADISSRMNDALATGGSPEEQLHNLLRLGAEVISEQVDLQPVILDFWAASRGKTSKRPTAEPSSPATPSSEIWFRTSSAKDRRGASSRLRSMQRR